MSKNPALSILQAVAALEMERHAPLENLAAVLEISGIATSPVKMNVTVQRMLTTVNLHQASVVLPMSLNAVTETLALRMKTSVAALVMEHLVLLVSSAAPRAVARPATKLMPKSVTIYVRMKLTTALARSSWLTIAAVLRRPSAAAVSPAPLMTKPAAPMWTAGTALPVSTAATMAPADAT